MAQNFTITLPDRLKERLKVMSKETGMAQSTLIKLASESLVANYEKKGSFIFVDLLNPEHKEN